MPASKSKSATKARPQTRRSQEDRRLETRGKLIAATIDVLNEKGYAAMRTGDITKKAKVTWGAAQHLFGSRAELMIQVSSSVSEALVDLLESDIETDLSAEDKLTRVIDHTWGLYSSKTYFAMTEIVRGTRKDPSIHDSIVSAQIKITRKIEKLWVRLFAKESISDQKVLRLCHIVTLYLSGLAARKMYSMPSTKTDQYIADIKNITVHELKKELN